MADVPGQESPSEEKPKGRSTGRRMMNWLGYGLEEEQDQSASAPEIEDAGAAINGDAGAQPEPAAESVTEVHSLPLAEETPANSDESVGPPPAPPASEAGTAAEAESPAPEPEPPAPEPEAEPAAHAEKPDDEKPSSGRRSLRGLLRRRRKAEPAPEPEDEGEPEAEAAAPPPQLPPPP